MADNSKLSWRRGLLAALYLLSIVGLVTPYLGFSMGSQLILGLPAAMVWVLLCLFAVFVGQLLVYLEDTHPEHGESVHPWEIEAAERTGRDS